MIGPGLPSHRPRKRFGQNFLVDQTVIAAMMRAVAPRASDRILEIGPGLGALTDPLSHAVDVLHVVEIDRDIVARLKLTYPAERLIVHEGDALEFPLESLGPELRVVGNLPYNISSPLLFHFAGSARSLRDAHVMLQKEVVERLVAAPGASEYSRLSVMLQYYFDVEKLMDVPPSAFRPAPEVESAVIRMIPRPNGSVVARDERLFAETVAAAFSQRRKTLRNALAKHLSSGEIEALGIDPQARAQTLGVEDFVRMADYRAQRGDESAG